MSINEKSILEIFVKHFPVKATTAKAATIERCGIGHGNYVYIVSDETERYVIRFRAGENVYPSLSSNDGQKSRDRKSVV